MHVWMWVLACVGMGIGGWLGVYEQIRASLYVLVTFQIEHGYLNSRINIEICFYCPKASWERYADLDKSVLFHRGGSASVKERTKERL